MADIKAELKLASAWMCFWCEWVLQSPEYQRGHRISPTAGERLTRVQLATPEHVCITAGYHSVNAVLLKDTWMYTLVCSQWKFAVWALFVFIKVKKWCMHQHVAVRQSKKGKLEWAQPSATVQALLQKKKHIQPKAFVTSAFHRVRDVISAKA